MTAAAPKIEIFPHREGEWCQVLVNGKVLVDKVGAPRYFKTEASAIKAAKKFALVRRIAKRLCEMADDRWSDTAKDGLIYRERAEELIEMVLS